MIRFIYLSIFLFGLLFATSAKDLFNKIKESKSSLVNVKKEKQITNRQLQKIANKIKKINKEISIYDKKLKVLDKFLQTEEKRYSESIGELKGINNMVSALDSDIDKRREEFAKILSKQLGSVVAQNSSSQKSEKSVVLQEVYDRYKNYSQQELLKLSKNIELKGEGLRGEERKPRGERIREG